MADPKPEPPKRNPALRMLGLPALPKKLPSRNWLIFWTLSTAISAGIIYDRREKRRATARWAAAVKHLAAEPLSSPSALPRKLTVYLSAPPGDGLRPAQDHFQEYVKPVLAASGVDWDFVVGRREGDVRAVVAERVRRGRKKGGEGEIEGVEQEEGQTGEEAVEQLRKRMGISEYEGVKGDIVIGRNTWKEYVRGLHEGWLGPLAAPKEPEAVAAVPTPLDTNESITNDTELADKPKEDEPKSEPEPEKPKGPSQPKPYILPNEYPTRALPLLTPAELQPSTEIPFPHILGFLSTPTRMRRFFGRRYIADDIGREVAAACFAAYREYSPGNGDIDCEGGEVEVALKGAEKDWVKTVWKEEEPPKDDAAKEAEGSPQATEVKRERLWASPLVVDPRIGSRMRRFEITPDDEEKARQIVVPEEELEGFIKGHLRQLWRWGVRQAKGENKPSRKFGDSEAEP